MKGEQNGAMTLRRFFTRRAVCYFSSALIGCLFFTVYVTYFRHPPPDILLRMQQENFRADGTEKLRMEGPASGKKTKMEDKEVERKSRDLGSDEWQNFIKANNFVSIGWVFDKCDEGSRQTVGAVVMMKDEETGGVKSRTYANRTFSEDVTEGQFYLEVKYNGRDLYDNYWDLCTLDEDREEQRQIFCPIKAGIHNYMTDNKIPSYLPKGKYEAKAWIVDQNEKMLSCGFCKFYL